MRENRSSYVDAAAWSALVAGAVLWCPRCRSTCLGHPMTAAGVEQLLAMPEPAEDVPAATGYSSLSS